MCPLHSPGCPKYVNFKVHPAEIIHWYLERAAVLSDQATINAIPATYPPFYLEEVLEMWTYVLSASHVAKYMLVVAPHLQGNRSPRLLNI